MEKEKKISKRDAGIELARILGCLIVVGVHTCLGITVNDHYDLTRTYIACLFADGVAIFWLIAGGFLFKNKNYKKLVIKSVRAFVVPIMLYSFFSFYFSGWLIKDESLAQSFVHTIEEYVTIIKTLFSWRNFAEYGGHLWYLYVYLLIIIMFPVLKCFVDYLDEDDSRIRIFMIVSFIILIINDISKNQFGEFDHHTFRGAVPASIEVIWGHILYRHREKFMNRKYVVGSVLLFCTLNMIRTIIQINRGDNKAILFWYSSIGLICAMCIIIFSLALVRTTIKSPRIIGGIKVFATYTFSIYIIHPLVNELFKRYDIQKKIMQHIFETGEFWYLEILYTIIILMAVFVCTFMIAWIIKKGAKLFSGVMNHMKEITK